MGDRLVGAGGGEVRFRAPVFAGDLVSSRPVIGADTADTIVVEALCTAHGTAPRVALAAVRAA